IPSPPCAAFYGARRIYRCPGITGDMWKFPPRSCGDSRIRFVTLPEMGKVQLRVHQYIDLALDVSPLVVLEINGSCQIDKALIEVLCSFRCPNLVLDFPKRRVDRFQLLLELCKFEMFCVNVLDCS